MINKEELTAYCKKCDFEDKYEPDEFGLGYFQAVGKCPVCGEPTFNKTTDKPTVETVAFAPNPKQVNS